MLTRRPPLTLQPGFSLLEVLITVVILSFGLLGLATLQMKIQQAGVESFQRYQALTALQDISARISANRASAASYVGNVGTGDSYNDDCSGVTGTVGLDLCAWSNSLKGAAEVKGSDKIGGMIDARGCIETINPGPPLTLRVTVAWQGLSETSEPAVGCGQGQYGADALRRALSSQITIAVLQ